MYGPRHLSRERRFEPVDCLEVDHVVHIDLGRSGRSGRRLPSVPLRAVGGARDIERFCFEAGAETELIRAMRTGVVGRFVRTRQPIDRGGVHQYQQTGPSSSLRQGHGHGGELDSVVRDRASIATMPWRRA